VRGTPNWAISARRMIADVNWGRVQCVFVGHDLVRSFRAATAENDARHRLRNPADLVD